MSTDAKSRYAAAAFIALLILSVFWPAPIVSVNHLWLHRDLPVDELSFLGREQPSWDVVFWCIAGLVAIAVVHSGEGLEWRTGKRSCPPTGRIACPPLIAFVGAIVAIAAVWLAADSTIVTAA